MANDIPGQVTFPDSASKGYMTDKDGQIYPIEIAREASEYLSGQGSMGFERNLGVKRDTWAAEAEVLNMGQVKFPKLKSGGSHNI